MANTENCSVLIIKLYSTFSCYFYIIELFLSTALVLQPLAVFRRSLNLFFAIFDVKIPLSYAGKRDIYQYTGMYCTDFIFSHILLKNDLSFPMFF